MSSSVRLNGSIAAISLRLAAFAALAGCGGSNDSVGFTDAAGGPVDPGGDSGSLLGVDGGGLVTLGDGGLADGPSAPGKTTLYAHDNTVLYSVDPSDPKLGITSLGPFDCIGGGGPTSMTDIAVGADGKMYGVATTTVFLDMKVSGGGVQCQQGAKSLLAGGVSSSKTKFYGASMAPKGTIDPSAEALVVGNTNGEMYAVDTTTGAITIVGTFGVVPADDGNGNAYSNAGTAWEMSGDIVFLANGGTPVGFATVRDCPKPPSTTGCNKTDTLIELDLSKLKLNNVASVTRAVRGQIVKAAGCNDAQNTSYGSMYGIAAFGNKVIGFSHTGFIVSIDNTTGSACLIADDSATALFSGAGVTTSAPIVAPPPK